MSLSRIMLDFATHGALQTSKMFVQIAPSSLNMILEVVFDTDERILAKEFGYGAKNSTIVSSLFIYYLPCYFNVRSVGGFFFSKNILEN